MRYVIKGFILSAVLLVHAIAWGAHPLITDDAGTQGKGKFQFEVSGQYDSDKETEKVHPWKRRAARWRLPCLMG
jgi:hypothetical protein